MGKLCKSKTMIYFVALKAGWIRFMVRHGRTEFMIFASCYFDPFCNLLDWLEPLAEDRLPCTWKINEELGQVSFEVFRDGSGVARLLVRGPAREDPENVRDVVTLIEDTVEPQMLARCFYKSFLEFVDEGYDTSQWGQTFEHTKWRRIKSLQR